MSSAPVSHDVHAGPGPATYIKIAIILGIFTIIETATYYIHISEVVITLALLVFMTCSLCLWSATICISSLMHDC